MKIAILGYGSQGKSAYEYWRNKNDITICDSKIDTELPNDVQPQLGDDYLHDLEKFDLIIRSPGIHPRTIVAANNERILRKVTTVTEEFFRACPAPIIGVTGTKGKGTTSTLITKILETAGKTVHLGGNIGIPPLDMLADGIKSSDYVVLELANFQLIDLGVSPSIAVCLMVAPEHLDWHANIDEYVAAKQNLFRHQKSDNLAIYNRASDLSAVVAEVSPARKMSYEVPVANEQPSDRNGAYVLGDSIYVDDEKVCGVSDVKLLGRHNLQNVCAAIMATWDLIDHDPNVVVTTLKNFTSLPNRLEPVRTLSGVTYYNDSFCTAPDALAAAVEAIKQPKVLIVGGHDRNLDLKVMTDSFQKNSDNIRKVVLIGASAQRASQACQSAGYTNYEVSSAKTMGEIVEQATRFAEKGDAVVLSPGFPSFDMFKNFEDRGNQYREAVNSL